MGEDIFVAKISRFMPIKPLPVKGWGGRGGRGGCMFQYLTVNMLIPGFFNHDL